jgi:hypothetical protein
MFGENSLAGGVAARAIVESLIILATAFRTLPGHKNLLL